MPLEDRELRDVQNRVTRMLSDTLETFDDIETSADAIYGSRADAVRAAIREYMEDFVRNTGASGQRHPEELIYSTSRKRFQEAGLYGAQLALKERQVTAANRTLRERLGSIAGAVNRAWFRRPFRKWVDVINNFIGSLAGATGISEALRELKDCLRDELPDDDE